MSFARAVLRLVPLSIGLLAFAGLPGARGRAQDAAAAPVAQPPPTSTQAELQERLAAHFGAARFSGARWGAKVVSLDSGRTLFATGAELRLSPASVSKLYAGALALDRLGGDYAIVTPVLAAAPVGADGVVAGDVVVSGRGDPGWNPRRAGKDFRTAFEPFIAVLQAAGAREIRGDIVADATWLKGPPHGAGWTVDDMSDYYGAEVCAITLDENYVDLRVIPAAEPGRPCAVEVRQPAPGLEIDNRTMTLPADAKREVRVLRLPGEARVLIEGGLPAGGEPEKAEATIPHPARWFAACLREAVVAAGIAVHGGARGLRWPEPAHPAAVPLGEVRSAPMRELVASLMKPSQNLKTNLVLAHLGERQRGPDTPAWRRSEELAVAELNAFLARAGISRAHTIFEEGSGLSRNNLTTADANVRLLQHMAAHREAEAFLASLPVAGVDGSLGRRFKGTAAEGNMRAKTGTLRYAHSLAGYVTTAAGERLVFSLMLNRHLATDERSAREELDAVAVMLARHAGRE